MKKYVFFSLGFILVIVVLILLAFNFRYPFFTPSGGNWSVGFSTSKGEFPVPEIDSESIITFEFINSITEEDIHYIADPFFIKEKDSLYLFVELKGNDNANIALLTSEDGKNYHYKGVVLDEDFHLSYPQVFKHEDNFYMLPEASGSNQVLLYRAENFPCNWFVDDTLIIDRKLKDPSILLSPEINLIVAVDDDLKQFMYTSDSLKGDWKEVKNYKQRWGNESRPGGRFFNYDNGWYLPLQNLSSGYGTGISLYRLKQDNNNLSFELSKKMFLGPQQETKWFHRGMHHVDIQKTETGFYMVFDGDRSLGNRQDFQFKASVKYNLLDFYNYFRE